MTEIGKRIREKREALGLTQEELAQRIGYRNKSTIAKIESGTNDIAQSKVAEFARALETSAAYLMGWDEPNPPPGRESIVIDVVDRVTAGKAAEAGERVVDTEEISLKLARTGMFFGLKIQGDGMAPIICSEDVVIVKKQPDAESGEIVIASVEGADAVCRRLRKYRDGIELISNNPSCKPMDFSNEEITKKDVRILGKVVEMRRKFC